VSDPVRHAGIQGRYGLARHSEGYIRREWSRFFEVIDIREGVIDGIQDLVILRKGQEAAPS